MLAHLILSYIPSFSPSLPFFTDSYLILCQLFSSSFLLSFSSVLHLNKGLVLSYVCSSHLIFLPSLYLLHSLSYLSLPFNVIVFLNIFQLWGIIKQGYRCKGKIFQVLFQCCAQNYKQFKDNYNFLFDNVYTACTYWVQKKIPPANLISVVLMS